MANYTAADIKALREKTGAGMLDVKKALDEADAIFGKRSERLHLRIRIFPRVPMSNSFESSRRMRLRSASSNAVQVRRCHPALAPRPQRSRRSQQVRCDRPFGSLLPAARRR